MVERINIPGGEWVYFKLYTGHKSAEDILGGPVYEYVRELMEARAIKSFFFIRYSDPDFHIRLRLRAYDPMSPLLYGSIFTSFHKHFRSCIDNNLLYDIQCGTYKREIERYGEETIEKVEEIFHYDSAAMIDIIRYLSDPGNVLRETERWQLALLLVDDIFNSFGYDLAGRAESLTIIAENFKKEFNLTSSAYTKQLNDKYRAHRQVIDNIMNHNEMPAKYKPILDRRRSQISGTAIEINRLTAGHNEIKAGLLNSITHMTMNRLFKSKNRLNETVVYEFLRRYYQSEIAKEKYSGNKA